MDKETFNIQCRAFFPNCELKEHGSIITMRAWEETDHSALIVNICYNLNFVCIINAWGCPDNITYRKIVKTKDLIDELKHLKELVKYEDEYKRKFLNA